MTASAAEIAQEEGLEKSKSEVLQIPTSSHAIEQIVSKFWFTVGVLCPVQKPGSYWDRSLALLLVGLKPTLKYEPVTRY